MDWESFEKQIRKELVNMSREQLVQFAWLSAVRALPFIGAGGNFDYWNNQDEEGEKQYFLYIIFRALDVSYNSIFAGAKAADNEYDAFIKFTGSNYDEARHAINDYYSIYASAAYSVVYSVVHAHSAAACTLAATHYITDCTVSAASAAASAAAGYDGAVTHNSAQEYDYDGYFCVKMQNILLADIKDIQNRRKISHIDLNWYGKVWTNFQQALKKENCSYWGNVYSNIFEKSFVLDIAALQKRINVPFEIWVQGAAAVARYLGK